MSIVVFIGPKGPSAWEFAVLRGTRQATCINDGTLVKAASDTQQGTVAALQQIAAHTVVLSGQPTLVVPIPW